MVGEDGADAGRCRSFLRRPAAGRRLPLRDNQRRPRPDRGAAHAISHDVDGLASDRRFAGEAAMPGLACIARVEATVEHDGRAGTSRRDYLSSATLAEAFARAVRAHWTIENGVHWVLDVTVDADRARNRKDHGPENLGFLSKLALNVLKRARPDISIRRKRKRCELRRAGRRSR